MSVLDLFAALLFLFCQTAAFHSARVGGMYGRLREQIALARLRAEYEARTAGLRGERDARFAVECLRWGKP